MDENEFYMDENECYCEDCRLRRAKNEIDTMKDKIEELRQLVYMEDIPHPSIPEYREHHESIQKILSFIDTELLKGE